MLQISDAMKQALQDDNCDKEFLVEFTDGTVLGSESIVNGEFSLQDSFCSQEELKFGLCEASIIEFECMGVGDLTGKEFKAYLVVQITKQNVPGEFVDTSGAERLSVTFYANGKVFNTIKTYSADGQYITEQTFMHYADYTSELECGGYKYTFEVNEGEGEVEYTIIYKISLGTYKVDSCKKQQSGSHKVVGYDAFSDGIENMNIIGNVPFLSGSIDYGTEFTYKFPLEQFLNSSIPKSMLNISEKTELTELDSTTIVFPIGYMEMSGSVVATDIIKVMYKRYDIEEYANTNIEIQFTPNEENIWFVGNKLKYFWDFVKNHLLKCGVMSTDSETGTTQTSFFIDKEYLFAPYEGAKYLYVPLAVKSEGLSSMEEFDFTYITSDVAVYSIPQTLTANPKINFLYGVKNRTLDFYGYQSEIEGNYTYVELELLNTYKVKDYLEALLELNGMYGVINKATGKLEYRTLDFDSEDADIDIRLSNRKIYCSTDILAGHEIVCGESNDYFITNFYEDYATEPFGKICVKYKTLNEANKEVERYYYHTIDENYENTYYLTSNIILLENVFTLDEIKAICEVLAPNIANRSFVPSEVELPSRPWIEAGDSFTTAEGNKAYVLDKKTTLLFDTYVARGSERN